MVAERFALHTLDAMMPASCFQGNGPSNQTSASGMNSLQFGPGSPMMNRIGGDTGTERNPGVAGNSPTGAAMQGNTQQAAVGTATTPAPGLVGQAGNLVGTGPVGTHIPPPAQNVFGSYGPVRGGLMDNQNYGLNQGFLGGQGHACGGCGACQGLPCQGLLGQGLQGQGLPGEGCMGTAGQNAQASTGRSQEPDHGGACQMPWSSGQCGVDLGQVGSGQTGGMCME